ncbi:MAG: hypothetical protein EOP00_23955 [Pedobacter sp.]|nr:MAG: hypothetical protein EOP00_23955 [Pedobacter sp.]
MQASSLADAKNKNYVGSINKKLNVVFSFTQNGNSLKGYYYYDKIGVNIVLKGELVGGVITLNEVNEQGKTVARITLKQKSTGLYGTWQSLVEKRSYPIDLQATDKEIPQLPAQVLGDYNFKNDNGCKITLSITKSNSGYHFYYQTAKRQLKGKVTFARSLEEKLVYVNLHGIEWAEDSGDVSKNDEMDDDRVLPTVVQGLLSDTKIVIQNTGNAMNYYVKLSDCDEKFIELIKWKRPN